jgi:hypothetical protein
MSQAQGFDLDNLENNTDPATHKVSVIDDADGNSVSGLIIVGKNSPEFINATSQIRIDNIKRSAKRKQQLDTSTDEGAAVLARTVDRNDRTTAMSVVIGWYGFLKGGAEVPFDKALLEKMFAKYPQWQVKVLTALEAEANFMKA